MVSADIDFSTDKRILDKKGLPMAAMPPPVLILFIGFAYVVLFGGLSLLRREGLSLRFGVESIVITGAASAISALAGVVIHPVLFLIVLYLITMRVRWLVDIATALARNGHFSRAESLFDLAERLWPDPTGKLVIQVNRGTAFLQSGKLTEAIRLLKGVLEKSGEGYLGVKYEAAAHYNLGVAYLRNHQEASAIVEFNTVLDTWPGSRYANHAMTAIDKISRSRSAPRDNDND